METGLLAFLTIIGLLALYWVLFGQWKYNKMMREADEKREGNDGEATHKGQ